MPTSISTVSLLKLSGIRIFGADIETWKVKDFLFKILLKFYFYWSEKEGPVAKKRSWTVRRRDPTACHHHRQFRSWIRKVGLKWDISAIEPLNGYDLDLLLPSFSPLRILPNCSTWAAPRGSIRPESGSILAKSTNNLPASFKYCRNRGPLVTGTVLKVT